MMTQCGVKVGPPSAQHQSITGPTSCVSWNVMKKDTFVQYWVEVGTSSTTMSKALQASHCNKIGGHPANTRHPHNVVLVLAHRLRR